MARLGPHTVSRTGIHLTTDTFNGIEEFIRWAEWAGRPSHVAHWLDQLCRFMAYANQGHAQKMSAGPYDPQERRPELAWRIPVRRISERYYVGWKVKRLRKGAWMLYNDSREAYFIEFGINPRSNRPVRRPIRKLSLRKTLESMMRTQAYHRIWAEIYFDPRRGKRHVGKGFTQTIQTPARGSFSGPALGRRLP